MTRDAPKYVRVYYRIIDDPKFDGVYSNDTLLANWLRLLLIADAIWPAPAPLPRTVRTPVLKVLVAAGLVDLLPNESYRIHGLDNERGMRSASGRNAAASRWHSERNADPMPSQAEQSKDEQSQAEQGERDLDGPLAYYEVTTRYPGHDTELYAWVTTLADGYGAEVFQQALAAEFIANHSLKDLLSRTESRLAKAADQTRKTNPTTFDRRAWSDQKKVEQDRRYEAEGGAA